MPRKDVAKEIGWTKPHLDFLCVGDVQHAGGVAVLFKDEYLKGVLKSADETKKLIQANVKTAQGLIAEVFAEIKGKKKKTDADKKLLSLYTNALAKFTPAVSVKNLSYSYTKGLLPEELVHEFKRLTTIAEASFDRGETVPRKESVDQDV